MASFTFPTNETRAAVDSRDALSCLFSNNSIGLIDAYHIQVPGV